MRSSFPLLAAAALGAAAPAAAQESTGLADYFPAGTLPAIEGAVESVRSEMLRYRPTLSYHP